MFYSNGYALNLPSFLRTTSPAYTTFCRRVAKAKEVLDLLEGFLYSGEVLVLLDELLRRKIEGGAFNNKDSI